MIPNVCSDHTISMLTVSGKKLQGLYVTFLICQELYVFFEKKGQSH